MHVATQIKYPWFRHLFWIRPKILGELSKTLNQAKSGLSKLRWSTKMNSYHRSRHHRDRERHHDCDRVLRTQRGSALSPRLRIGAKFENSQDLLGGKLWSQVGCFLCVHPVITETLLIWLNDLMRYRYQTNSCIFFRIGIAREFLSVFRVAWEDPADPEKGFKYLYLTPEDYSVVISRGRENSIQTQLIQVPLSFYSLV